MVEKAQSSAFLLPVNFHLNHQDIRLLWHLMSFEEAFVAFGDISRDFNIIDSLDKKSIKQLDGEKWVFQQIDTFLVPLVAVEKIREDLNELILLQNPTSLDQPRAL
jgi:hypothetical protein